MMSVFWALLRRDLLLAFRHRGELLNPLLFFSLVVTLFPLGVSPEPSVLKTMAPGVIWIAVLLAGLFSLEGLFRSDFEDGTLEQMVLSPFPLAGPCQGGRPLAGDSPSHVASGAFAGAFLGATGRGRPGSGVDATRRDTFPELGRIGRRCTDRGSSSGWHAPDLDRDAALCPFADFRNAGGHLGGCGTSL